MIKLKALLTEHFNDYSWLSPNGTFYPTNDHERTAKELLKRMSLSPLDKDGIEYTPYELMYKFKFLRVVNMKNSLGEGKDIFVTNRYNTPTQSQLRALIDLAIEHGYNKVVFTTGRNDQFTLWDKSHQLE